MIMVVVMVMIMMIIMMVMLLMLMLPNFLIVLFTHYRLYTWLTLYARI